MIEHVNGERVDHWSSPSQQAYPEPIAWVEKPLSRVIRAVLRCSELELKALRGSRQTRNIVDARFAIAMLAREFAPRTTDVAVEEALCRGRGLAHWYASRWEDRAKAYPEFAELCERARALLRNP